MTGTEHTGDRRVVDQRPGGQGLDAGLVDTMALLGLVRDEERVLARLRACAVELDAIRLARGALADRTGMEVVEAQERLAALPSAAVGRCVR